MVAAHAAHDLGESLAPETRLQLCGRLVLRWLGRRIEDELPGRQGRWLFAYLAAHRRRPALRSELLEALWPGRVPAAADTALSALLTKLRGVVGADAVAGKHELRLLLPVGARLDIEAAHEALHRAESAVAQRDWVAAWGPARVALHIAVRGFLPGCAAPWAGSLRDGLADALLRAHECVAACGIGLGGTELASAQRSARALVQLAPYRESGWRLLMQVLAAEGNAAEALLAYERLRRLLREELGALPAPQTEALHRRLLQR